MHTFREAAPRARELQAPPACIPSLQRRSRSPLARGNSSKGPGEPALGELKTT